MKKLLAIDRDDFAKATDDYNSVHFGPEGIAHGCHVLGWAAGKLCDDGDIVTGFSDVQFRRPVPIGSKLGVWVLEREGHRTRAAVFMEGWDVQVAVFTMWRKDRAKASSD